MSRKNRRKRRLRVVKKPLPARVTIDPKHRRVAYKIGKEYQPIGPNGEQFVPIEQAQELVNRMVSKSGRFAQRKRCRPGGILPIHV